MPSEEQKVCDACHERPATFYSIRCLGDGENTQTRDLCMACWEQLASPDELTSHQRFQELIRTGKCKYCGAQAAGGSMSGGWPEEEHFELRCDPCQKDYAEVLSRPENKLPDDFPDDEDAAMDEMSVRLSRVAAEAEAYVRQRAAERGLGNDA